MSDDDLINFDSSISSYSNIPSHVTSLTSIGDNYHNSYEIKNSMISNVT